MIILETYIDTFMFTVIYFEKTMMVNRINEFIYLYVFFQKFWKMKVRRNCIINRNNTGNELHDVSNAIF